jgi:ribosomal protein S18 acetylase RimI-like enzyme
VVATATPADVVEVVALIELTYRGPASQQGWTSETHLVGGDRTSVEEVADLIATPHTAILVAREAGTLVGCCLVTAHDDATRQHGSAYFGMFAVRPSAQNRGIGRRLLAEAERYAREHLRASSMTMHVIDRRPELLNWYGRRGYAATGERVAFPVPHLARADIELVVLRRDLTAQAVGEELSGDAV